MVFCGGRNLTLVQRTLNEPLAYAGDGFSYCVTDSTLGSWYPRVSKEFFNPGNNSSSRTDQGRCQVAQGITKKDRGGTLTIYSLEDGIG